jgi:hypothetical protein
MKLLNAKKMKCCALENVEIKFVPICDGQRYGDCAECLDCDSENEDLVGYVLTEMWCPQLQETCDVYEPYFDYFFRGK